MVKPLVLVHGGAGNIENAMTRPILEGCKKAAMLGYNILKSGASVTDAVETAIKEMENNPLFNAGYGAAVNIEGEVEMDASIMVGEKLSAGAVTAVKDVRHPISLARLVMEKTPHVLIGAHGAVKFAKEQHIQILPPCSLVTLQSLNKLKYLELKFKDLPFELDKGEVENVGAIAIDANGHLAAATSTGGINGQMVGRKSNSSQIGSGVYADDNIGAVTTTGHGESTLKFCLAHTIIRSLEKGKAAQLATSACVRDLTERLNSDAGAITVSSTGGIGIAFTSQRMGWAYHVDDELHYGIEQDQHEKEHIYA